jgi:hypothetical protein
VAQLVVVDQILVAQRNPNYPLPDQSRYRVLDQLRRAVVRKAAGKPLDQPDRPVGGGLQSYVRPVWCGRMTAGPDGLRGSGPKQKSDV